MKSVLLEALEAVGTPVTGNTWEAVWEAANGSNVVAYYEASADVTRLFGLATNDESSEEGQILDLGEESFNLLQRMSEGKTLATLQIFAANRYQMHRWIENLKREAQRAQKLIGY